MSRRGSKHSGGWASLLLVACVCQPPHSASSRVEAGRADALPPELLRRLPVSSASPDFGGGLPWQLQDALPAHLRRAANATGLGTQGLEVLANLEGGWFDGTAQSDLCGAPRTATVMISKVDVQQGVLAAEWAVMDVNQSGLVHFSYSADISIRAIIPSEDPGAFEANISVCLSNVSSRVLACRDGGSEQASTWLNAIDTFCRDTSQAAFSARCCSSGRLKVVHMRHQIVLQVRVADPRLPTDQGVPGTDLTQYEWRRKAIDPRTFEFAYCSCDATANGLGIGACPRGVFQVSEAMAWHCEASITASHLTALAAGRLLNCPATLDQIAFQTAELGLMTLDLSVLSDSSWVSSSNGCYGTLKCVEGPCVGGQETVLERASRCGPIGATGDVPAAAAIKYIYPNTAPTAGGTELTSVGV